MEDWQPSLFQEEQLQVAAHPYEPSLVSRRQSLDFSQTFLDKPYINKIFQQHKVLGGLSGFVHFNCHQKTDIDRIQIQQSTELKLDRLFNQDSSARAGLKEFNSFFDKLEDLSYELLNKWQLKMPSCLFQSVENTVFLWRNSIQSGVQQRVRESLEELLKSFESLEKGQFSQTYILSNLIKFGLNLMRRTFDEINKVTNKYVSQAFRKKRTQLMDIQDKSVLSVSLEDHSSTPVKTTFGRKYVTGLDKMMAKALQTNPQGMKKQDVLNKIQQIFRLELPPDGLWRNSVTVLLASSDKVQRLKGLYYYHSKLVAKGDLTSSHLKGKVLMTMIDLGVPSSLKVILQRLQALFQPSQKGSQNKTLENSVKKVINRYDVFDKSNSKTLYKVCES